MKINVLADRKINYIHVFITLRPAEETTSLIKDLRCAGVLGKEAAENLLPQTPRIETSKNLSAFYGP